MESQGSICYLLWFGLGRSFSCSSKVKEWNVYVELDNPVTCDLFEHN